MLAQKRVRRIPRIHLVRLKYNLLVKFKFLSNFLQIFTARSKSYNDAHRPSPFRNNRPISRIRLFNHGKSGPERIDDYSDQEERDLRVQAKAAEVKLTQSNSIEEYAIFQSRYVR